MFKQTFGSKHLNII